MVKSHQKGWILQAHLWMCHKNINPHLPWLSRGRQGEVLQLSQPSKGGYGWWKHHPLSAGSVSYQSSPLSGTTSRSKSLLFPLSLLIKHHATNNRKFWVINILVFSKPKHKISQTQISNRMILETQNARVFLWTICTQSRSFWKSMMKIFVVPMTEDSRRRCALLYLVLTN